MYYIKRGKQSKAFLKCLQTAALKGKLPKRYLFKCLRIKTGKILHFIKDELCEAFHEAKTVSASAVVLVAVGGAVTALALNLCILHVKVADLQTELREERNFSFQQRVHISTLESRCRKAEKLLKQLPPEVVREVRQRELER